MSFIFHIKIKEKHTSGFQIDRVFGIHVSVTQYTISTSIQRTMKKDMPYDYFVVLMMSKLTIFMFWSTRLNGLY